MRWTQPSAELQGVIDAFSGKDLRDGIADIANAHMGRGDYERAVSRLSAVLSRYWGFAVLRGQRRVEIARAMRPARIAAQRDSLPFVLFREAIDAILDRHPMLLTVPAGKDPAKIIQRMYRDKGFTLARAASIQVVGFVQETLGRTLGGEITPDQAAKVIQRVQADFTPHYAKLVLTNNLNHAYHDGIFKQMDRPAAGDVIGALTFAAIGGKFGDGRTSGICKACHGTIAPHRHPVWKKRRPPLHHNCRSGLDFVLHDDYDGTPIITPLLDPTSGKRVAVAPGFGGG